jgi:hypothetical protein
MDISKIQNQVFAFVLKYRWYVLPGAFFVLVFLVIFVNQLTQSQLQKEEQQQPEVRNSDGSLPGTNTLTDEGDDNGVVMNVYEDPETLIKKDTRPDGSILYTNKSPVEGRPNEANITNDGNTTLFTRSVSNPSTPVSLKEYLTAYGTPEYLYKGSKYFGTNAQQYIYPNQGLAFIGNPQTDQVLEVHTFNPLTIDDYVAKYGSDIVTGVSPTISVAPGDY